MKPFEKGMRLRIVAAPRGTKQSVLPQYIGYIAVVTDDKAQMDAVLGLCWHVQLENYPKASGFVPQYELASIDPVLRSRRRRIITLRSRALS